MSAKKWTKIEEILDGKKTDETVNIRGWIYRTRSSGNIVFIILRDSTGILQTTVKRGSLPDKEFDDAKKALIESSVELTGSVKKDDRAPGGYEIQVSRFHVVHFAEPFPITKDHSEEFLLDVRHLWLRSQKMTNILRVRSKIFEASHNFLRNHGYIEVQPPIFTTSGSEGGATIFELKYFDKKAYLRQSPQLYKQLAVGGLERVFEIGPAFRAEKHWTIRHLCEFTSMDIEVAWIDDIESLLEYAEEVLEHIFRSLISKGKDLLELVGIKNLSVPERPFPIMTWKESMKIIKSNNIPIEGKDLPPAGERFLHKYVKNKYDSDFVWIVDWPFEVRPFYAMKYTNTDITKSMDLIYRGLEILTGGQREHRYDMLKSQISEKNLNPSKFGYYLDAFKYGFPPHGGWAIGLDRLIMQILGLKNVREAVLFPRDPERVEP